MDEEVIFRIILQGVVVGVLVAVFAVIVRVIRAAKDAVVDNKESIREAAEKAKDYAQNKATRLATELDKRVSRNPIHIDAEYFGKARAEYHSEHKDPALYAKSLALVDGNEAKAEAMYIKLRAEELTRG